MMRKLLLSALLCSSASLLQAQPITLDQSNYAAYTAGDSVTWDYAQTSVLPSEGADQMWDYSYVKGLDLVFSYKPEQPTAGIFPNATYMNQAMYNLGSYSVEGWVYYEVNSTGDHEIGNQYIGNTFNLAGGMGTLTIPDQTNTYTPALTDVQFPLSYPSTTTLQSRLTFDASLTIPILQMNNTPAQLVQNYYYTTEVVGWGQLKMPGGTTYDALLVKRTSIMVDSFYVAGAPADPALLAGLGLTQADSTETTSYRFLTPGVKGSILSFNRSGAGQWMSTFRTNLTTTSVTDEPVAGNNSRLYPNPVVGTATLAFEKTSGAAWTVAVYNTPGQLVQSYRVEQPAGEVRFELTSSAMPAGSYRYEISNEFGVRVGNGMMVVVK